MRYKQHKNCNRKRRRHLQKIRRKIPEPSFKRIYEAPEILSFEDNQNETRKFFQDINDFSTNKKEPTKVTLEKTKSIDLGAALVLTAIFHRWRLNHGASLSVSDINKWDSNIVYKLSSLGFFKLLGMKWYDNFTKRNKKTNNYKQTWIQFITDARTIGAAATKLRKRLLSLLNNETLPSFYKPLIEAMKNAIEHAYLENSEENSTVSGKRWWMAGDYNKEKSYIEIAFLDLGITIPSSIRMSTTGNIITKDGIPIKNHTDAGIIQLCSIQGISRLGEEHRGKGFHDILNSEGIEVIIVSGKGLLYYAGVDSYYGWELNLPFHGTLIRWFIQIRR